MINELQKREEIFSCELELQQLEQSQAMQSANQAMQQYVMQNEVENRECLLHYDTSFACNLPLS